MLKKIHQRALGLIWRVIQLPRIVLYRLISTNSIEGSPRCYQPVQSEGMGLVSIQSDVKFGAFPSPLFLSTHVYLEARNKSACIVIGSGTWINNNFCAIAEFTSISIGQNCRIGANVEILDSDFHGTKVEDRGVSLPEWAKPVQVGDNVFIGSNVKIMKGVTIGNGSIIANGSLVSKDVPANVIAGGNPAKVIKVIS